VSSVTPNRYNRTYVPIVGRELSRQAVSPLSEPASQDRFRRASRLGFYPVRSEMCDELTDLRRATARYATQLNVTALSLADVEKVLDNAGAIESSMKTLRALCAARSAELNSSRGTEHRSPQEGLARRGGMSVSSARQLIETGKRLSSQDNLLKLARRGELSFDQIALVADASEADPHSERRLIEKARNSSISELKDECANTKARADRDPESRRSRIHKNRSLRSWTDVEGVGHLRADGNPEAIAQVMVGLHPYKEKIFEEARAEGRKEPEDAYAFDALVALAKSSMSSDGKDSPLGPPKRRGNTGAKILVRIDYDTFLRGAPTSGEVCEIVGFGPVSVSAVKELIETENPFIAAILTKARRIVGVAHLGRRPTAHQQSGLEWLYPTCAALGCPRSARLERDHTIDWSKTRFTAFDHLDLLCHHHHRLKTTQKWALVEGRGKRAFVGPDDPRHPGRMKRRSPRQPTGPPGLL
jgi:hypothetical protein